MQLLKVWTSQNVPLDVDAVALDLRIDSDDDRATLERMIRAAGDFAEQRTGFVFNAGTYRASFTDWCGAFPFPAGCRSPQREIMRAPFRNLNAIRYLEARDSWIDVDVTDFAVSEREKSFVVTALSTFDPSGFTPLDIEDSVAIEFDAGFDPVDGDSALSGETHPIDPGLSTMLTMLVGHYYKNRELFDADKLSQIEVGAGSLLGAYRQFW